MLYTPGLVSVLLSIIIIILIQKIYLSNKIIDEVNSRSSHNTIATRSGGVSIFLTLLIMCSAHYIMGNTLFDYSIIFPLGLLIAVGCYDDLYNVDYKLKFVFQIIAAKMIIDTGLIIDNFHGIMGIFEINRLFAQIFTIFIIVSVVNAINFIDGVDTLAISVVSLFILLFEFFSNSISTPYSNLSIILISSVLPLYFFNLKKKSKVFLGDAGSHFLGGVTAIYVIYILSNNYLIKIPYDIHKIIFVFSILSYPIIDLTRVIIIRIFKGSSIFTADNNHIHHFLVKIFKHHIIVTALIILSTLLILLAIQIIF